MNENYRDPGLINKLYRNPRRGMIFGVCAGIAEYFGFDVTVTRVVVAIGALFAFPMICGAYVVLAFLLPAKRYTGTERDTVDPVERQVRASPHDTLASVRYRFRDLDARLQRLEKYVTSNRYRLDREFRRLEE
ncbi:MAG TPA: envelope stress response membrane protein PspC [Gammaproteobacteria bacterium]